MEKNYKKKIKLLKKLILEKGIDGYILPSTDEYLNEYVPENHLRLKWLTGFTGSNGLCLVLQNKLIFFTDGRYLLQARDQLVDAFEIFEISKTDFFQWVENNLDGAGLRIAIDTPCIVAGEDMHGKVFVMVKETTNASTLNLALTGREYAKVHYTTHTGSGKKRKTHHKTATSVRNLMTIDISLAQFPDGKVSTGNYEFPFTAKMPQHLPSSMTISGRDTCRIEYFAHARLTRPGMFKFDATAMNK